MTSIKKITYEEIAIVQLVSLQKEETWKNVFSTKNSLRFTTFENLFQADLGERKDTLSIFIPS